MFTFSKAVGSLALFQNAPQHVVVDNEEPHSSNFGGGSKVRKTGTSVPRRGLPSEDIPPADWIS